jgi:hypothetical protein
LEPKYNDAGGHRAACHHPLEDGEELASAEVGGQRLAESFNVEGADGAGRVVR